ncbi:MAG: hypothetical protein DI551_02580 [Micavibrio aeruginosavorus]|uniref:anthranilate synthase n=1 Tax=Micavibrio aeruginosavorus TaxID=349221 RepID=A0A2W5PT10_9BACT|nr:MAG: hypothetical protein DI551_02580 [Micavibrio aeruginosavorus]
MPAHSFDQFIDLSKPFAILEKHGTVTCYQGPLHVLQGLDAIHALSLQTGKDVVFLLPYRIIRERGFEAKGDEPILALSASRTLSMDKEDFIATIKDAPIAIAGEIVPDISDEDYAALVKKFQENEIGGGNTSQTILSRRFEGNLCAARIENILSIYKRLLQGNGQYMTVLFANIDSRDPAKNQYIVSATPERHLEISGDEAIMIPIAGTLRKEDRETFPARLQAFVRDEKEINELFQVLDEELKMMGSICPEGGEIRGPFLREIGAVVHTEYELVGRRPRNTIAALRETLHAPTVTGSPIESATRIIEKYETQSRRYYSGEVGIYKALRTKEHYGDLDTAILIRGMEIRGDGKFFVQAGGGLVKDSDPDSEAKESAAKAMGVMSAVTGSSIISETYLTPELHDSVREALMGRNAELSSFWMNKQNPYILAGENLQHKAVTIVNNEDNFAFMIKHLLERMGAKADVVDTLGFDPEKDKSGIVVLGPGPGDPNDMGDARMKKLQECIKILKERNKPMLGICLGHQALSVFEKLSVKKQDAPTQGEARKVSVFGQACLLGFYNSFSPVFDAAAKARHDIAFDTDENGRIIAMEGSGFVGFQFHPESVLSRDGYELIYKAITKLDQGQA